MPKERGANPVAAHAKAEKNKALKKSKASVQAQRAEKLARRNPERLQRQIDDLQATKDAQGGSLRPRDAQQLEQLERDVAAIRKARASLPESQQYRERRPHTSNNDRQPRGGNANDTTLGKRRRGFSSEPSDSEATDPEALDIPMPRDTPPPVPRRQRRHDPSAAPRQPHGLPAKPPAPTAPSQTTYSSAPQLRDLKKEAVSAFVPSAVAARLKQKQQAASHTGKLLEPEELDRLEQSGYTDAARAADEAAKEEAFALMNADAGAPVDLAAEEAAFERELARETARTAGGADGDATGPGSSAAAPARLPRQVELEEVEDDGD